jgi:hypothetical protein
MVNDPSVPRVRIAGRRGSRRADSGAYQRVKTASGSPRTSSLARYSLCCSSSVRASDVQVCGCTRCAQADVATASKGTATFRSRRIRDLLAGRRVLSDGGAGQTVKPVYASFMERAILMARSTPLLARNAIT